MIARKLFAVAVLAALAPGVASPAFAGFQFAAFTLADSNQPFSFVNNSGTSATFGVSAQVNFDFTAATGLSTADRAATLTLTGSTTTPASAPGGSQVNQPLSAQATLSITENGTGKSLLAAHLTGDIVGKIGSSSASLAGSDKTGQVVDFSSDFGTFTTPGNSYDLNLDALSPTLNSGLGGFLESFVANVSGEFSADFEANPSVTPLVVSVPEPASGTLLATGAFLGLLGYGWRRKKYGRST